MARRDSGNSLEQADLAVAGTLLPLSGDLAVRAIGAVSDLSDQEPLYAASAAVIATAAVMRDNRTLQTGLRLLATHLFATALRGVVKQTVDRTRPIAAAERGHYELGPGERYESDFNSFPSGHSAGAVAVARVIARRYPGASGPALGLAAASAGAQVLRSKHYLTDVVAGAAIGWMAEELLHALLARCERI
ncbi:phosphatase PAP2 family protein [Sphingomonas sp. BN140010]|uniref:Phosphatase PAP2 family protein n=1 Tax=Sphingomonas arvum TaxID=2992113 RepID=A0ABT3JE14_9SPHN|nr:phosphatase PAP2 family protein [Sphingomonas sp. BN140010]MCW3797249.1 phosphatase PAP2 family protein [Sphingomonas sp. BN140010]